MSEAEKLFKFNLDLDKWLQKVEKTSKRLKDKRDPRKQFELWRSSLDGKTWKSQQYTKQQGKCAICQHPMPLKGSHIDHIKPIANYPDLALDLNNLQLTCSYCNLSKGTKNLISTDE
jgi:5-methylcytosine-specific restriction endonuclease McrA